MQQTIMNALLFLVFVVVASAIAIYFLVKKLPNPHSVSGKGFEVFMGLVGWYAVNGITWFLLLPPSRSSYQNSYGIEIALFSVGLIPFNIIFLLILASIPRTRMIVLGILIAMALNFMISLLLGMTMNAFCFIPFFNK